MLQRAIAGYWERLTLSQRFSAAGGFVMTFTDITPFREAEQALRDAPARGSRLVLDAPEGLRVHADPERLAQVVANLLDNAAKWSPAGATVDLQMLARDDGLLELTVADAGPGAFAAIRREAAAPFATMAGIYLEAARLLAKRATFHPHPRKRAAPAARTPAAARPGGTP